jgi:hypothetical protein
LLLVLVYTYVCSKHYLCTWLLHIEWACTKKVICTQHCSVCYSFHIVSFLWEEVMCSGRQNIRTAVWYVSGLLLSSVIPSYRAHNCYAYECSALSSKGTVLSVIYWYSYICQLQLGKHPVAVVCIHIHSEVT